MYFIPQSYIISPLIHNVYHSILIGGRVRKSILLMTFSESAYLECSNMNFACYLFPSKKANEAGEPHFSDIAKVKCVPSYN